MKAITSSTSCTKISQESFWWTLKSQKTNTLADWFIERTLSMLHEIASRLRTKKRILINKGKISKTPNEVKPVKNVNKNHHIFLGRSPCKAMYMSNKMLLN